MDPRARAARLGDDAEQPRQRALDARGTRERHRAPAKRPSTAYRDALQEWTRERVPLDWAMTQNNLGIALSTLGERESGTERARRGRRPPIATRCRNGPASACRSNGPMTQNNLGNALSDARGTRERHRARSKTPSTAYRDALQGMDPRARAARLGDDAEQPRQRALDARGTRERHRAAARKPSTAYRDALKEWTRERVPLHWATDAEQPRQRAGLAKRTADA